jgi:hypothetical protein
MVKYWKTSEAARAKVTIAPEGHYYMFIEGEKYPFPGFPRGAMLVGGSDTVLTGGTPGHSLFAQTKHIIKNFIFNASWAKLEASEGIIDYIKNDGLDCIGYLAEQNKYFMLPETRLVPAVKEIYRAFTVVAKGDKRILALRDILTFILQEDDGYRFRVQWTAKFIPWLRKMNTKFFVKALTFLEHAEVVGDMREKIVLLRTVLTEVLKDKTINRLFEEFCREVDWKKVKLSKADLYYFRAKFFRADYPQYKY